MPNDDADMYEKTGAWEYKPDNSTNGNPTEEPNQPTNLYEQVAAITGVSIDDLQDPKMIAWIQERLSSFKGASGETAMLYDIIREENQRTAWENRPKLNMYPTIPDKDETAGNDSVGATAGNTTGESSLNGATYISGTGGD